MARQTRKTRDLLAAENDRLQTALSDAERRAAEATAATERLRQTPDGCAQCRFSAPPPPENRMAVDRALLSCRRYPPRTHVLPAIERDPATGRLELRHASNEVRPLVARGDWCGEFAWSSARALRATP